MAVHNLYCDFGSGGGVRVTASHIFCKLFSIAALASLPTCRKSDSLYLRMMETVKSGSPAQLSENARVGSASDDLPPIPEFVHIADGHVIWRNAARPKLGQPVRIITWEILIQENDISVRADINEAGVMEEIDFREVRMRLNEILLSETMAEGAANWHQKRLHRSLYWQRTPDDDCQHLNPAKFDEETGIWSFSYSHGPRTPDHDMPLDGKAIRPVSNQMLIERHQERQWMAYAEKCLEWAKRLSLDPALADCLQNSRDICTARLLHYWRVPECRKLFTSSANFAILFCSPGILPELEDPANPCHENAIRLASLPPEKLLEHIGLPASDQILQLFKRIKGREIIPNLQLIRYTLNNPLAVRRLSETTCSIEITMLKLCGRKNFPINWHYFLQQCTNRPFIDPLLVRIDLLIDFFPYSFRGRQVRRAFRKIRNEEEFKKIFRIAFILRENRDMSLNFGARNPLINISNQ